MMVILAVRRCLKAEVVEGLSDWGGYLLTKGVVLAKVEHHWLATDLASAPCLAQLQSC
jgi:hypothetical protein